MYARTVKFCMMVRITPGLGILSMLLQLYYLKGDHVTLFTSMLVHNVWKFLCRSCKLSRSKLSMIIS